MPMYALRIIHVAFSTAINMAVIGRTTVHAPKQYIFH
jgi:hypothetical protein